MILVCTVFEEGWVSAAALTRAKQSGRSGILATSLESCGGPDRAPAGHGKGLQQEGESTRHAPPAPASVPDIACGRCTVL